MGFGFEAPPLGEGIVAAGSQHLQRLTTQFSLRHVHGAIASEPAVKVVLVAKTGGRLACEPRRQRICQTHRLIVDRMRDDDWTRYLAILHDTAEEAGVVRTIGLERRREAVVRECRLQKRHARGLDFLTTSVGRRRDKARAEAVTDQMNTEGGIFLPELPQ